MKRIIIFFLLFNSFLYSQVRISKTKYVINHESLRLYLDADSNSLISVQYINFKDVKYINGYRTDKWFSEWLKTPYNEKYYYKSGYDLGHLTPSNSTSFDKQLNSYSFSYFNQAPQLARFNRVGWRMLEADVLDSIKKYKVNSVIITGVIYNNIKKVYLKSSRIKIPESYFKILIVPNIKSYCWIGSNSNGIIKQTTLKEIIKLAKKNKNNFNIEY
jgi:DNA/RNA endonuclease G (NUC1)